MTFQNSASFRLRDNSRTAAILFRGCFLYSFLFFAKPIEHTQYGVYDFGKKLSEFALERLLDFQELLFENGNFFLLLFNSGRQSIYLIFGSGKLLYKLRHLLFLLVGKFFVLFEVFKCAP